MTLLEAYLDESERPDGSFCVAGYAFTSEQLKRFNREWSDLTGGRVFHTKDVIGRRKAFKYLVDNEESNRLIREAVGVIDRHISLGVQLLLVNWREKAELVTGELLTFSNLAISLRRKPETS